MTEGAGLSTMAVIVVGTIALVLLLYGGMRIVALRFIGEGTHELAGSVMFRVAALHALILGLVFAQETRLYQRITDDLVLEATAVADVYYDLDRYGSDAAQDARAVVIDYTRAVVEEDWPVLAEGRLSPNSYLLWEAIYQTVLDLPAQTAREVALREHMLEAVHEIADLRQRRVNAAQGGVPALFWFAAIGGLVFVTLPYFVYRASAMNLTLLVIFGAFTGLVLAIIYAFADPFSPPGRLSPVAFLAVLEGMNAPPN